MPIQLFVVFGPEAFGVLPIGTRSTSEAGSWHHLCERLEAIYATGRVPFEDAVSEFSDGTPTVFFEDAVWPRILDWLNDACALAERMGPERVRHEIWERIKTYTGKSLPQIEVLDVPDFAYPLEQRDFGPDEFEDYFSHIDYRYLAQLFLEEMIADARWAAQTMPEAVTADRDTRGPKSDLVTIEWVADIERIKPESIFKRIRKYELEHGRLPDWVAPIPGKQRGRMIRWNRYSRQG